MPGKSRRIILSAVCAAWFSSVATFTDSGKLWTYHICISRTSPLTKAARASCAALRRAWGRVSMGPESSQLTPVLRSLALLAGASVLSVLLKYPCATISRWRSCDSATRSHFLSLLPSVRALAANESTSSKPSLSCAVTAIGRSTRTVAGRHGVRTRQRRADLDSWTRPTGEAFLAPRRASIVQVSCRAFSSISADTSSACPV